MVRADVFGDRPLELGKPKCIRAADDVALAAAALRLGRQRPPIDHVERAAEEFAHRCHPEQREPLQRVVPAEAAVALPDREAEEIA